MEGVTVCGHHPECRVTFGRGGPHIACRSSSDSTWIVWKAKIYHLHHWFMHLWYVSTKKGQKLYNNRHYDCPLSHLRCVYSGFLKEKGRDLAHSYDKSPYTDRKIQKATFQHKKATKNFDYTTIADRLRTVSWGNDSHPTGVV